MVLKLEVQMVMLMQVHMSISTAFAEFPFVSSNSKAGYGKVI
jgi:hypothetical protein